MRPPNSRFQSQARSRNFSRPRDSLGTKLIRYGLSLGFSYDTVLKAVEACAPNTEEQPCDEFFD